MKRLFALLLLLSLSGVVSAHAPGQAQHGMHEQASTQAQMLGAGATFDRKGRLWVVTAGGGHVWLRHSDDFGKTLSKARAVNAEAEAISATREDHPKVVVGSQGQIYVAWVHPLGQGWASSVRFARSTDGGQQFSAPITVNAEGEIFTHSFNELAVDGQGRVVMAWIDASENKAASARHQTYHGLAVHYSWSSDDGESFAADRKLADHSCECCRLSLARTPDGRIAIMLRMLYAANIRDHAVAELQMQGQAQPPQRVTFSQWQVAACPEQGPGLAIGADGVRHAVWFEASQGPAIWYGQLDPGHAPRHKLKLGGAGAGHASVAADKGTVWVAWNQVNANGYALQLRRSDDNGVHFRAVRTLAESTAAVYSPQLLVHDGRAYVAWNTEDGFRLIAAGEQ